MDDTQSFLLDGVEACDSSNISLLNRFSGGYSDNS
jgi:hypothetical protein